MTKADRYPEAELVLDDELVYDDNPRRSAFMRREERPEDIVREGEVLAGKYRVERIPGRNGLGVLVQVRHMELGQEVTLKFLVPEACAYPEFVQRFVREARAAVRIQGEHVARVTDVGRLESGAPYMVREFLRGPDLAEVLKVRGPLPIEEAVDYIIQACEGVAEGHALGVVHRNLRPTSLVVARRSDGTPLVKVFDFAASESLHVNPFTERAVSLVGTSAIMASLPYLAPEQIRDPHDVDFRADVYSLGAILFELLAGSPVYAAEAAPALLAQVAADPAPALRTLRSDAPAELDHIVLRCLAKNRAIRYASVAELVLALRHFGSAESASSVEHIVRLGKRTSKLPELSEGRLPSPLPPAPAPLPSVVSPSQAPARGRHGTVLMHSAQAMATQSIPAGRASVHDDVTTINPYASYAAPVVITPADQPRSEPQRYEPPRYESLTRTEPLPPVRLTPQPPPLRASSPPPLTPPPLVAPPPLSAPPPMAAPPIARSPLSSQPPSSARVDSTSLPPPPRSSVSGGLTRSWAVPEEPPAPFFSQKRLAIAAIAACATLGAVFATRAQHGPVAAAPAPPPPAAPARVEPPPPAAAPVAPAVDAPAVVASASATPATAAPAAPVAAAAPAPAAPAVAAPAVAAPARPAPVAVAPARPAAPVAAAAPAPRAPTAARRPAAEAPLETPRKPAAAAEQKVASSRPVSGGDMFDNPR